MSHSARFSSVSTIWAHSTSLLFILLLPTTKSPFWMGWQAHEHAGTFPSLHSASPFPILVALQGPDEVSPPPAVPAMCVGCQPTLSPLRVDQLHHPDEPSVSLRAVLYGLLSVRVLLLPPQLESVLPRAASSPVLSPKMDRPEPLSSVYPRWPLDIRGCHTPLAILK